MIIPRQASGVHLFVLVRKFPLLGGNTCSVRAGAGWSTPSPASPGLILPRSADPFVIFIMRQFFWNLPRDLESAARIDGASECRTYTNIMLPLAMPGLSVLVIFTFEDAWNDILWPLIVLYSERLYTVQIGLLQFQTDTGAFWNWLMAATVTVTVPMIIIFLVFQRCCASACAPVTPHGIRDLLAYQPQTSGIPAEHAPPAWIARQACRFLEQQQQRHRDQPFFL